MDVSSTVYHRRTDVPPQSMPPIFTPQHAPHTDKLEPVSIDMLILAFYVKGEPRSMLCRSIKEGNQSTIAQGLRDWVL